MNPRWILGGVALFAMAWAIARAATQSITIDEAMTYNIFVFNRRYLWYAANNHILNSTLMYGVTKALGLSQFTARLPALLGAALYIAAAYRLVRLLGASLFVQLTVFVCLVFNPFIFDYLVAARGYGLALGFLMWAIVYFTESHRDERSILMACAISSVCAGMSVNANFSFAFVSAATMIAIFFFSKRKSLALLAACVIPGVITVAIISGYALLHMRPGELIYGATSLSETFGSILEASQSQLIFPLVGITGIAWLFYSAPKIPPLGWIAAAIFTATVAIHWIAFLLFDLLLPKDRTAIYFFPLFMIFAAVLATIPVPSSVARYLRAAFTGSLAVLAISFLLSMRLTYFKEWQFDADVQKTYSVLACLNREYQMTHVASTWPYRGSFNFYQHAHPTSISEIDENFDPQQTQVYVVDLLHTPDAMQGKELKIFYRGPSTDLVLTARPSLAENYSAGVCLR